jgi:hypothetical protein
LASCLIKIKNSILIGTIYHFSLNLTGNVIFHTMIEKLFVCVAVVLLSPFIIFTDIRKEHLTTAST